MSGSRRPGTVPGVRVLLLAAQIALCSLCLGCLRRGQPAKDKKLPDARDLPPPQAQCQQELFPHARSATKRISALPSISAKCEFLTNTGSTRTKSCGVRAREQTRRPTRGLRSVTFPSRHSPRHPHARRVNAERRSSYWPSYYCISVYLHLPQVRARDSVTSLFHHPTESTLRPESQLTSSPNTIHVSFFIFYFSRRRSEHATADMFKELMKNNAGVDVAKAQAAGGGGEEEQGAGDDASASAKDLLMRLPGVNVHNYRNVRACVCVVAPLTASDFFFTS